MKVKNKLKHIKNMRELNLYKQNLEYQEKLLEREVAGISEDIIDNFTDKLRDFTFKLTSKLVGQMFSKKNNS